MTSVIKEMMMIASTLCMTQKMVFDAKLTSKEGALMKYDGNS
jgi:hypothetical protein